MNLATRLFALALASVSMQCSEPSSGAPPDATAADAPADANADNGWQPMAAVGGGPIQETGVAALDGSLYLVGGFDASLQLSSAVQIYTPESDQWSQAAPLPIAVHHANVTAANGALYVLGAMQLSGASFAAVGNSYVYSPKTDSWRSLPDMPLGTERGSAAVGLVGNRIILAGGLQLGPVDTVVAFNLDTQEWETSLPNLPTPTDHHVGAVINDVLYVIGGRSGGIASVKDTVLAYSQGATEWEERAPLPTARGGAAAGVVRGQIVVVGGEGNPALPSGVFPQSELYDPAVNSWSTIPDMSVPRHGMGAVGIAETLYVPGGATKEGFGATAASERFRF